MQVIVEELVTNYTEVGTGSHIALFLHGWADSLKTFDSLAIQFAEENPNYKAVLLDLPGFGGTQQPNGAWGLDDYARFVQSFLTKKQYQSGLLIGHSNGGAIAIVGLANQMLTADGLILIASAGVRQTSTRNQALKMISVPAKLALSAAPKSVQKRVKQKAYDAIGSDYMVAEHMQETFKKVVAQDVTDEAKKLNIPTCLIYGEEDEATPPSYGEQLQQAIVNSQMKTIPLATHFVHQEQVYKVSTIMTEFTKSI